MRFIGPEYIWWGRQMAANWGVKGRQGPSKGGSGGSTGRQGGVTGGVTFEGGGRQSKYGDGSGGGCLLKSLPHLLNPKFQSPICNPTVAPHISLPFSIKKDLITPMHLLFIMITDFNGSLHWVITILPAIVHNWSRTSTLRPTPVLDSIARIPFSWDFWPDGQFQSSVSPQEIADTHMLAANWVLETVRSRGSPGALTWQKGHELRRQCPNASLDFVGYEPKYTVEPVHTSVAASTHPSPDASEDGSDNESTTSWYGIYSKNSIWFRTLTDQSCKEGKQVDVSMDDMFDEAEEPEVQMDAEADENEEGVLEEEEEWEVQRDPEANESEEASAVRGMDAMRASADPIIVASENQLSTAQLATFEAIFKSAHTHYFTNSSVVFYEYNWHGAAQPMELPRPHIRIRHQGQDILLAGHLPMDTRSKKRRFRAVEAPNVLSDTPQPVVTASRKRGYNGSSPK
ncbi:hypothetical protein DFH08DRAFT_818666 [Mycena albidolilacea]|uniref:Uncharacterized protein n=1 Tax=Mycena albidolilacea TaxID=1033008 RepID=A0AAD6ZFR2_9AGAR|nr:hypothetical protein DFH08DRAFT_818666 [Mycena albidolilacea]